MTKIEQKLNSMTGYTTAFIYDEPNNRYNYSSAEVDSHICDAILEADSVEIVEPKEESYVLGVMVENWEAEFRPAESVQDDNYSDVIKSVFFSEDGRMIIARKGDTTTYMVAYE